MLYALLVAALTGVAGSVLEYGAARSRLPRRGIWALALLLSLLIPMGRALMPAQLAQLPGVALLPVPELMQIQSGPAVTAPSASAPLQREPDARRPSASESLASLTQALQRALLPAWLVASGMMLVGYALLSLRLFRMAGQSRCVRLEGQRVWLTDSLGPAVCGLLRPRILLPRWVVEGPDRSRVLIVAHEQAHLDAGDARLLFLGVLVLMALPWNLPLWWQLRRLRLAIEVDCDARVLARHGQARLYAETLLQVAERRGASGPFPGVALTEAASQLRQRIRIFTAPVQRPAITLTLAAAALGTSCIAGAAVLQSPVILQQLLLRKLPYPTENDYRPPHFALAQAAARRRFPELFQGHFNGSVEITVGLDRHGQVLGIEQHALPPPSVPMHLMQPFWFGNSWARAHGYESQDVMEAVDRHLENWHGPQNADKLYLSYDVMKWPHDPARSAERVRAALLARYPQLMQPLAAAAAGRSIDGGIITAVMHDDGTLDRVRFDRTVQPLGECLRRMGYDPSALAHRGVMQSLWWDRMQDPRRLQAAQYHVRYAWPRHPDDPPDVASFDIAKAIIGDPRSPWNDDRDAHTIDPALVKRYFPDVWRAGAVSSEQYLWFLLDRQGRVFATGAGAGHREDHAAILQALFRGITTDGGYAYEFRGPAGRPVMLGFEWLGADSPITRPGQVAGLRRSDLVIMASVFRGGEAEPLAAGAIDADLGIPAVSEMRHGVRLAVTAHAARAGAIALQLRLKQASGQRADGLDLWPAPAPSTWVMPEQQGTVQWSDRSGVSWRVVLRVHRLATQLRWPAVSAAKRIR